MGDLSKLLKTQAQALKRSKDSSLVIPDRFEKRVWTVEELNETNRRNLSNVLTRRQAIRTMVGGVLGAAVADDVSVPISNEATRRAEAQAQLRRLAQIHEEQEARRALVDNWYWLRSGTKTLDRQDDTGEPIKPFPDRPYFGPLTDAVHYWRENRGLKPDITALWKSRTMMMSWWASGYLAWLGFTRPATQVLIQSQDERRAVEIVENIKILWINSSDALKKKWAVDKAPDNQPYNEFTLCNRTNFVGIPGGAHKIRSFHPTIYMADEAAIMEDLEDCVSNAVSTRCHQLILVSSAYPGFMNDKWKETEQIDWPIIEKAA